MLKEQTFYGLNAWKCFHEGQYSIDSIENFKIEKIKNENNQGYIVLFVERSLDNSQTRIECYKKHATSILKFILIGKFPIPIYNNFMNEIDLLTNQTHVLEQAISKPEFSKYTLQRKLYFNLE